MSTLATWKQIFPTYFEDHPCCQPPYGGRSFIENSDLSKFANGARTILEIGVGYGRLAKELVKKGRTVYGGDIGDAYFDDLRALGIEPVLLPGDGTLPFEDRYLDLVYSGLVFQHLDPDQVLRYLEECRRVLAPGGLMYHQHLDRVKRPTTKPRCPATKGCEPFRPFHMVCNRIPPWATVETADHPSREDLARVFLRYTQPLEE